MVRIRLPPAGSPMRTGFSGLLASSKTGGMGSAYSLALSCQMESDGLESEIRRLEYRKEHRQEHKIDRRRYAALEHWLFRNCPLCSHLGSALAGPAVSALQAVRVASGLSALAYKHLPGSARRNDRNKDRDTSRAAIVAGVSRERGPARKLY